MVKIFGNLFKKSGVPKRTRDGNKYTPLGVFYNNADIWLLAGDVEGNFFWFRSTDGKNFGIDEPQQVSIILPSGKQEDSRICDHFRMSSHGNRMAMTYRRLEETTKGASEEYDTVQAFFKTWNEWQVPKGGEPPREKSTLVSEYTSGSKYSAYGCGVDMVYYESNDLSHWSSGTRLPVSPREDFFDHNYFDILGVDDSKEGVLVVYDTSVKIFDTQTLQVGASLFWGNNPSQLRWRSEVPLWEQVVSSKGVTYTPLGMVFVDKEMILFYVGSDGSLFSVSIPHPFALLETSFEKAFLSRVEFNPLIRPEEHPDWGKIGVFNPTAVKTDDGRVHVVYRAIGLDGISRFGYAVSKSGDSFDEVHPEPVFYLEKPRHKSDQPMIYDPNLYPSGGSWGGCEDPRMVKIEDRIYISFNTFDGWDFIRMAVSSISEKDFLEKKWKWSYPMLISPPGQVNKNWVLFPEKIREPDDPKGPPKFAILHSITPHIQIDYVETLEDLASGKKKIRSIFGKSMKQARWDTWSRGVGPPPIKTSEGWLVLYHAMSNGDSRYKLGAMLLDLKDPKKVIGRSSTPILVPEEWYENDLKPGVVYACGAVVKDGRLIVYYGGGDKHVCSASAPYDEFLAKLKEDTLPEFELTETNT